MNEPTEKALVPVLRFPEFKGVWEVKILQDLLSLTIRERKKPITPYTGLGVRSHGKGTFLKYLENPEKNSMKLLYEVQRDDLVVSITFAWEGAIAIAGLSDTGSLVSHRFPTYIFKRNIVISEFFRYIILDKQFVYKLGVISPGGAGRNRVLNKCDFLKLTTLLPNIEEQQKIADCLTSLDQLINAQSQKIDLLKTHKKALMQQLFPLEGETVPRLRFPEFRGAGEWEAATLGDKNVSVFVKERLSLEKLTLDNYVSTENLLPEYAGVKAASKLPPTGSFTRFKKGDVLISNIRPYLKKVWSANKEGASSNDVIVIRAQTKVSSHFLTCLLKNDEFINYIMKGAKGVKMPRGDISLMKDYPIAFPCISEQQKIADCLSSLDQLINAHSQKLTTLKTHKKALMQQLFPAVAEELA